MTDDKVIVADAPGATPRMPFWRRLPWRLWLGERVGVQACRGRTAARGAAALDLAEPTAPSARLRKSRPCRRCSPGCAPIMRWTRRRRGTWSTVAGQLDHAGAISSDRSILVEIFEDFGRPTAGDQSPWRQGQRAGGAGAGRLRERTGVEVEVQSNDDGILFRFPEAEADIPLDLLSAVGGWTRRASASWPSCPLGGLPALSFARERGAALIAWPARQRQTPFWLQRLRQDLLQLVRRFEDFPSSPRPTATAWRRSMDWPNLERILRRIRAGEIQVTAVETLTPIAGGAEPARLHQHLHVRMGMRPKPTPVARRWPSAADCCKTCSRTWTWPTCVPRR